MTISERIFDRLKEMNMSQTELSRRTGIATSTISDWRKKNINPQADKLVLICKALGMSLVDLLCAEEDKKEPVLRGIYDTEDQKIIEMISEASSDIKKRVLSYYYSISCTDDEISN